MRDRSLIKCVKIEFEENVILILLTLREECVVLKDLLKVSNGK